MNRIISSLALCDPIRRAWNVWLATKWYVKEGSIPPRLIKQRVIKNYAHKFQLDVFIETGTYLGDMVDATKSVFKEIYSIELDSFLYKRAKKVRKISPHSYLVW